MHPSCAATLALCLAVTSCAVTPWASAPANVREKVAATERAFAKTMADRDHQAFASFISSEAVFFSGTTPLRGSRKIVDSWAKFFAGPSAPFSWEPTEVELLDSGELALSSGPVRNAAGKEIATFTSIWRLEAPDTWRIVFDKGNDVCNCGKP